MSILRRFLIAVPALLLLGLVVVPASALAHERRTIDNGKYDVVVGWVVEPAYQGLKNAASIRISQAGSNPAVPIEGVEKTLRVQIRQGNDMRVFPLHSVFGQKGYYVAHIVPTRAGNYQWTFVGNINGDPINDLFDTADGKFNGIEPVSELQFPIVIGDTTQVARAAQLGQVISAVWVLDNSGLHDLDESLDTGTGLLSGALGRVQHAQLVTGATVWPAGLQDTAAQVTVQLTQLRNALEAGDMGTAAGAAHEANELGHDLSGMAYTWLASEAKLVAPGGGMETAAAQDAD